MIFITHPRREWDSNPRTTGRRLHALQACALDHSAISPFLPYLIPLKRASKLQKKINTRNIIVKISDCTELIYIILIVS